MVLPKTPDNTNLLFSSPKNLDECNKATVFGITAKLRIGIASIESIKFGKKIGMIWGTRNIPIIENIIEIVIVIILNLFDIGPEALCGNEYLYAIFVKTINPKYTWKAIE